MSGISVRIARSREIRACSPAEPWRRNLPWRTNVLGIGSLPGKPLRDEPQFKAIDRRLRGWANPVRLAPAHDYVDAVLRDDNIFFRAPSRTRFVFIEKFRSLAGFSDEFKRCSAERQE
jgi:hypothetical protein